MPGESLVIPVFGVQATTRYLRLQFQNMYRFPADFIWGTATSSYQIEGAWKAGGKGPSIWDAFCQIPGRVADGDHGMLACDHFHQVEADIQLMADMGLKAYRFSIAWTRIQPNGKGEANPEGIRFYNQVIDALIAKGITPWITLYHWDLPLALQLEEDGWLNPKMADYFEAYAQICFSHFGDRVKNWITLNEPWVVSILGYGTGLFAPGRVSDSEPYMAAHQLLRAHGKAVKCYREQFQSVQQGKIGITNNCDWREPLSDSQADQDAAQLAMEFFLGWFGDPIYFGDYPASMRARVKDRLPVFSEEDLALIKGSSDFFGLNHYTTLYASQLAEGEDYAGKGYSNGGITADQDVNLTADPAWAKTTMDWPIVPWGCNKLLHWINNRYSSPDIFITENGCALDDQVENGEVNDQQRLDYVRSYLIACHEAIAEGVPLKGYFVWSFMDNFEWASGYSKRFGIHYVDFETMKRIPKASAKWFATVIDNGGFS